MSERIEYTSYDVFIWWKIESRCVYGKFRNITL